MSENRPQKICFYPGRESQYVRTQVIRDCLSEANVEYADCSYPAKRFYRYFLSTVRFLRNLRRSDIIIIGFCGQLLVLFARIFTKKPIIFDAYISIFETLVHERKRFGPKSPLAHIARFLDKRSCELSDIVLLDTNQHIEYFKSEYGLDQTRFRRFIASCGKVDPAPNNPTSDPPKILYYGEFQSLHGVPYIVEAARLVPEAHFQLIGKGRELKACRALTQKHSLKNVEFVPYQPAEKLVQFVKEADICLGLFGGTPKSNMVIPNKVYDYLSLAKATITQDSPAIKEIFVDKRDLLLCKAQDPESLAEGIRAMLKNPDWRTSLAHQGHQTYQEQCSTPMLTKQLKSIIDELDE